MAIIDHDEDELLEVADEFAAQSVCAIVLKFTDHFTTYNLCGDLSYMRASD